MVGTWTKVGTAPHIKSPIWNIGICNLFASDLRPEQESENVGICHYSQSLRQEFGSSGLLVADWPAESQLQPSMHRNHNQYNHHHHHHRVCRSHQTSSSSGWRLRRTNKDKTWVMEIGNMKIALGQSLPPHLISLLSHCTPPPTSLDEIS